MGRTYFSRPEFGKGIGIGRKLKPGFWWFEARENNTERTNELLNEMAVKYSYQEKLIWRLTTVLCFMAPIFAILEFWDILQIISMIGKVGH